MDAQWVERELRAALDQHVSTSTNKKRPVFVQGSFFSHDGGCCAIGAFMNKSGAQVTSEVQRELNVSEDEMWAITAGWDGRAVPPGQDEAYELGRRLAAEYIHGRT
jgi:hypothetical protein